MLVIQRKLGESIMIGDEIEVRIVRVRGDQVRLGIDAPKSVRVDRREVYDKIKNLPTPEPLGGAP